MHRETPGERTVDTLGCRGSCDHPVRPPEHRRTADALPVDAHGGGPRSRPDGQRESYGGRRYDSDHRTSRWKLLDCDSIDRVRPAGHYHGILDGCVRAYRHPRRPTVPAEEPQGARGRVENVLGLRLGRAVKRALAYWLLIRPCGPDRPGASGDYRASGVSQQPQCGSAHRLGTVVGHGQDTLAPGGTRLHRSRRRVQSSRESSADHRSDVERSQPHLGRADGRIDADRIPMGASRFAGHPSRSGNDSRRHPNAQPLQPRGRDVHFHRPYQLRGRAKRSGLHRIHFRMSGTRTAPNVSQP